MRLYFAAPLFCQAELTFNRALTEKIEALGFQVFASKRWGYCEPRTLYKYDGRGESTRNFPDGQK